MTEGEIVQKVIRDVQIMKEKKIMEFVRTLLCNFMNVSPFEAGGDKAPI